MSCNEGSAIMQPKRAKRPTTIAVDDTAVNSANGAEVLQTDEVAYTVC